MKKVSVLGIFAGLALVAVLYYFVSQRPAARLTAPTLVPAESLAFFYLPDVPRSVQRWKESSVHAILEEPEVRAFVASAARESGRINFVKSHLKRIAELEPQEAFLSLQSIDGDRPQFVAGLRFSGDKAKVEALIKEAADFVKALLPAGTADLVQRGSKTIETFSSQKVNLAATFHEDWYLIGSGVPEIEQTLMRFRGDEKRTLARSEAYRQSLKSLPEAFDTMVFLQPGSLTERLAGLFGAAGLTGQEDKVAQFKRLRAIAATTKMDGRRMRDSVLTLVTDLPKPVELTGRTARFASRDALLYYAAAIQARPATGEPDPATLNSLDMVPLFALLETTLAAHEVSVNDLPRALGPEMGAALEWAAGGGAPLPTLAVEVRNRALAEKFVEALIDPRVTGVEASRMEENGVTYYILPETSYGTGTLALSDEFLALGLNREKLAEALAGGGEKLEGTDRYRSTMDRLRAPTISTGWIDARGIFERLYGTVRPMLIMMAAFGQQQGPQADFGKLPEAETIARHLGPIAISQSEVEGGLLVESEGHITVNQALGGVGATVAWLAGPLITSRLQESLETLSGGMLGLPAAPPSPSPEASPSPDGSSTPLVTPGYVSPVPDTLQDESVNPPISEETPAVTVP